MYNYLLKSLSVAAFLAAFSPAWAVPVDDARSLMEAGKAQEAVELLSREVTENPAYEAARVLLAEALEKVKKRDEAMTAWKNILDLSGNEDTLRKARMAVARLRRQELDTLQAVETAERTKDPFLLDMPPVDWDGLEKIEDSKYKPAILPPPMNWEVPPFPFETQHFTVYSANDRLSKVVGERAEIYLDFMNKSLFGGRSWAVRFPILVYTTIDDYNKHGGPQGSGGVTYGHITGKTQAIVLFQLKPNFGRGGGKGKGSGGGNAGKELWKYGIESVLPHELTHAVINEFFSSRKVPQWLHEAMAGRFEQTRDHYGEAARLSRKVVAGEFFRLRDLFNQDGYPAGSLIELFYEQAAAVVLYIFETGPEAMHAFLSELAAGNGHDAACAAALGIPVEGGVEEFERRWVEWMRQRYTRDLAKSGDNPDALSVDKSENAVFRPWVNELDTVESIATWRDVELSSLDAFAGVGQSKKDWMVENGFLRCNTKGAEGASLLGIRMNEEAPVAITCDVKFTGLPGDANHVFGFAQLDADGNDMRIEATGPLRDNNSHKIVCLWSDELAVYIDGVCTGRFPAWVSSGNARDVDFPIALVAYGPMDVQNLRVAAIKDFSDKPVVASTDNKKKEAPKDTTRPSREDRRKPRDADKDKKGP